MRKLIVSNIMSLDGYYAVLPDSLVIDYNAAKAALLNFSKSLSKEVGPRGVRVNTVSPGPVATPLWLGEAGVAATVARASGGEAGDVAKQAADDAVTARFTRPEEWPTSSCCWPATAPATSPAPTSSLTADSSLPCEPNSDSWLTAHRPSRSPALYRGS